jgi:hypothetical protein
MRAGDACRRCGAAVQTHGRGLGFWLFQNVVRDQKAGVAVWMWAESERRKVASAVSAP